MLPDHIGVDLECAISHPRHTVMFTNFREGVCSKTLRNFGITRDLQKTFCQTINIIRLNQQAAASSLYDFCEPAASRLNYWYSTSHCFEQEYSLGFIVRSRY